MHNVPIKEVSSLILMNISFFLVVLSTVQTLPICVVVIVVTRPQLCGTVHTHSVHCHIVVGL